ALELAGSTQVEPGSDVRSVVGDDLEQVLVRVVVTEAGSSGDRLRADPSAAAERHGSVDVDRAAALVDGVVAVVDDEIAVDEHASLHDQRPGPRAACRERPCEPAEQRSAGAVEPAVEAVVRDARAIDELEQMNVADARVSRRVA